MLIILDLHWKKKKNMIIIFSFFRHFSHLQIEVIAGGDLFKQRMRVHVYRARAECGLDCDQREENLHVWKELACLNSGLV
jgi:hypothetical protein